MESKIVYMRQIVFIASIFFLSLFSGCLMCDIRHDLWNKDRTLYDFSGGNGAGCALEFKIDTRYEDVYSKDTLHPRLLYEFEMVARSMPLIKLNSFSFSKKMDGVEPIPYHVYLDSYGGLKVPITLVDSLPFYLPDSIQGRGGVLQIVVESSEACYETDILYISYDIEVGAKRIVKENIMYKRRWTFDWRPKLF